MTRKRKKSQEKLKTIFELNENENTTYPNPRGAVKSALRRKFVALNAYIRKEVISKFQS